MTRPVLFDTNILIDWSKKYAESLVEISYWDDAAISLITWMELMAGTANGSDEADINRFLVDMKIETIQIDDKISAAAATIIAARRRGGEKMGLQDALIQATAAESKRMLITRNAKDFRTYPLLRIPYELETETKVKVTKVRPANAPPHNPFSPKLPST